MHRMVERQFWIIEEMTIRRDALVDANETTVNNSSSSRSFWQVLTQVGFSV